MTVKDANIGALELGILFSTLLYGVITLQVLTYALSDFKDSFQIRGMVGSFHTLISLFTYKLSICPGCTSLVSVKSPLKVE